MLTGDQILELIQKKYPGFHPVISISDIAMDDGTTVNTKLDALKVIAKYTCAEVKSIDLSGILGHNLSKLELLVSPEYKENKEDK